MSSDYPAAPGGEPAPEDHEDQLPERVAELAGEISEATDESRRERLARQLPRLAKASTAATRRGMRSGGSAVSRRVRPGSATGRRVRSTAQWLTSQVLEMAPKIPIRTAETLRAQYPSHSTEQLADALITSAARASAGIGAAVGAAAVVPFLPTAPVELGVETLALIAVELKLIAELHEVYGMRAPGGGPQRMAAYTTAWANRRGVRITSGGLALAVGSPVRRQLERRVLMKASQSAFALAPLLTGAAAGALIDHRETRRLGHLVRTDLRKRAPGTPGQLERS